MTTYDVHLVRVDTTTVRVEADDYESAVDKALNEVGGPSICHQCARGVDTSDWDVPTAILNPITEYTEDDDVTVIDEDA